MGNLVIVPTYVVGPRCAKPNPPLTPQSGGLVNWFTGLSDDASLIDAISSFTGLLLAFTSDEGVGFTPLEDKTFDITAKFACDLDTVCIGTDIGDFSYFGLPSGFIITSLTLNLISSQLTTFNGNGDTLSGAIILSTGAGSVTYPIGINNPPINIPELSIDYSEGLGLNILNILTDGFSIEFQGKQLNTFPANVLYGLAGPFTWTGTYEIIEQQYPIIVLNPNTPIYPGDPIIISAPKGFPPGFPNNTPIVINYPSGPITIPPTGIIILSPTLFFIYNPPPPISAPTTPITIVISGPPFSGSVPIGSLTVLYADYSGIYVLDDNQTHDTIYFRAGYTTSIELLYINLLEEETYEEDSFFYLLKYPTKVLASSDYEKEDTILDDFTVIGSQQIVTALKDVEIPSPFAETAFIP